MREIVGNSLSNLAENNAYESVDRIPLLEPSYLNIRLIQFLDSPRFLRSTSLNNVRARIHSDN